jgi:hypothetical protein
VLERALLARPLLLKPPEKKSKKLGCGLGAATRLRAGFFGSTAAVFSTVSAVASGVAAAATVGSAEGVSAIAGAAAGATGGVAAGASATVGATAGVGAATWIGAGAWVGAAVGAGAGATFAVTFDAAGRAAALAAGAGRLAATGDGVTASARAASERPNIAEWTGAAAGSCPGRALPGHESRRRRRHIPPGSRRSPAGWMTSVDAADCRRALQNPPNNKPPEGLPDN